MSEDFGIIQHKYESVATLFLWVTRLGTAGESQRLHDTRHQLLELWDRIHITNPAPAETYLDVLLGCTDVNDDRVAVCPRLEQVAGVASICLLHVLSSIGPTSMTFEDIHRRYIGVIPRKANFEGPSFYTMNTIHALLIRSQERLPFEWMDYKPCAQEHTSFASTLVQVAYNSRKRGKVPRWVLRFSLHSMLLDPEPPVSVIDDCLMIIAIDLGCSISESDIRNPDKRYAYLTQLHSLLS